MARSTLLIAENPITAALTKVFHQRKPSISVELRTLLAPLFWDFSYSVASPKTCYMQLMKKEIDAQSQDFEYILAQIKFIHLMVSWRYSTFTRYWRVRGKCASVTEKDFLYCYVYTHIPFYWLYIKSIRQFPGDPKVSVDEREGKFSRRFAFWSDHVYSDVDFPFAWRQ